MNRRTFLQHALGAAALPLWPGAAPARQAQRRPARTFAAGPPAAALVYALAPDALVGWPSALDAEAAALLGPRARALPVVGRLAGRASTVSSETLLRLAPDLILDVGSTDATYQSLAERVRTQTGIRYELLDGRLDQSASVLRRAGELMGVPDRGGQLARTAERLIADVAGSRSARAGTRVYFARGTDGLQTGLAGSINVEVLEFVGARNVAADAGRGGLTQVSPEQLLQWDPDIVLTQDATFAQSVPADPVWRTLRAVREGRVWLAPSVPFGWLDAPPGVNRLVGARWLARRLDGAPADAVRSDIVSFHDEFYGVQFPPDVLNRLLGVPR